MSYNKNIWKRKDKITKEKLKDVLIQIRKEGDE